MLVFYSSTSVEPWLFALVYQILLSLQRFINPFFQSLNIIFHSFCANSSKSKETIQFCDLIAYQYNLRILQLFSFLFILNIKVTVRYQFLRTHEVIFYFCQEIKNSHPNFLHLNYECNVFQDLMFFFFLPKKFLFYFHLYCISVLRVTLLICHISKWKKIFLN